MTDPHRGCAHNEERSPYRGLGLGPCAGEMRYSARVIEGLQVRFWICERHQSEVEREQDPSTN